MVIGWYDFVFVFILFNVGSVDIYTMKLEIVGVIENASSNPLFEIR